MLFRRKRIIFIIVLTLICCISVYRYKRGVLRPLSDSRSGSDNIHSIEETNDIEISNSTFPAQIAKNTETTIAEQWEKGYDLPVDEQEAKEAEKECKEIMGLIFELYQKADKGIASNVVLSDAAILEMQKKVMKEGYPVTTSVMYSNMENDAAMDQFLKDCSAGKSGSIVIYEIYGDGGVGRMKFIFDGTDMRVIEARGVWDESNQQTIAYIAHTRIKKWKYTVKGWFCYELCVPKPPEVSEIVDGSCMMRVKPMTEQQREMSEKCVKILGYQGNNLLCSNWDAEHMEALDYNGLYEYLYEMKYHEKIRLEEYPNGIPKEQFEALILAYLPLTEEQLQEYAVFDEEHQIYVWVRLGCFNYTPTFFGTSLPEVTDIRENEDATVTLTVDAVCDMVICDDAVITHELTLRFAEDGSFQYLGNKILDDGVRNIPNYQYRIRK